LPPNLVGNAVATVAVAKWENALDAERLKRMLDGEDTVCGGRRRP
jgi:aerobic C4-dicarboxylate transport protein